MAKEKLAFLPITDKKNALTLIVLVGNAFAWYYVVINVLDDILEKSTFDYSTVLIVWIVHFCGIIFSALLGAAITREMGGRRRFLMLWMILGMTSSLALMLINITDIASVVIISLFLGVSLGLGMPNCMGYFTECVSVENRGKISGITILFSGLGMLALGTTLVNSIIVVSIILVLWRASALAVFLLSKPPEKSQQSELSKSSYKVIFSQRSFLLYFVPWVMFSLVNYLSTYIEINVLGTEAFMLLTAIETGLIAVVALVGGFFIDSIGRKRIAIIGFVMLGVGYGVLGLYPFNPFSWYFNIVADGVAWGFFFVIFVVTIWGDLSHTAPSDKYYALGVSPFFISKLLELIIGKDIAGMVSENALFSFIAFFLFLAVLPLIYAPETLPEKKIKERELKSYIEKAQKAKEKYS